MIAAPARTITRERAEPADGAARSPDRPAPPPTTRRRELRRAAAVQAAWLAELR